MSIENMGDVLKALPPSKPCITPEDEILDNAVAYAMRRIGGCVFVWESRPRLPVGEEQYERLAWGGWLDDTPLREVMSYDNTHLLRRFIERMNDRGFIIRLDDQRNWFQRKIGYRDSWRHSHYECYVRWYNPEWTALTEGDSQ